MIDISDIARSYLAAYNSHDPARIIELLSTESVHENVAPGLKHETPEQVAAGLSPFFNSVPDALWTETQIIPAGNSVVIVYLLTGHLMKDIATFKARGQVIDHAGAHVLKVEDGKIVSAQDLWDAVEFARMVEAE
jgi:steroid delta-isomerase-like uncharacterized protein